MWFIHSQVCNVCIGIKVFQISSWWVTSMPSTPPGHVPLTILWYWNLHIGRSKFCRNHCTHSESSNIIDFFITCHFPFPHSIQMLNGLPPSNNIETYDLNLPLSLQLLGGLQPYRVRDGGSIYRLEYDFWCFEGETWFGRVLDQVLKRRSYTA